MFTLACCIKKFIFKKNVNLKEDSMSDKAKPYNKIMKSAKKNGSNKIKDERTADERSHF